MKPWTERYADLYEAERAHWTSRGYTETTTPANEVAFEGEVSLDIKPRDGAKEHHVFKVRVVYPVGYPHYAPNAEFLEPPIKRSRHMAVGQPCLYPPRLWNQNVPASEVEEKIQDWLRGHVTGSWPRELPLYELPTYYVRYAPPTIFMSDRTLGSMAGRDRGRFSVTEFQGYDVAVLKTVDQAAVGQEILSGLGLPRSAPRLPRNGRWYRLDEEPRPVKNTAELASVLRANGYDFNDKDHLPLRKLVGLVFDDAHSGETQWLMLDYGVTSKTARRPIPGGWDVRSPRIHVVSRGELFKRLMGINDVDLLNEKRITVFGVGAIGSYATLALAREGLGEFCLCDPDRLTPGNIARHALDLLSVGRYKADALADAIYRVNPEALVEPVTSNLNDPNSAEQYFGDADLVLAAIGDDTKEEMLTEVAVTGAHDTPILVARTLHAGSAFRLMLVRPGRDACMGCLHLHQDDGHPDWIEVPDDDLPDIYDEGCAAPSRPGAGLASEEAAVAAAKRITAILQGWDGDANHWLHVRNPIQGADSRLDCESVYEASLPPHPDCRWCRS